MMRVCSEFFDAAATFRCGQVFRYTERDGLFTVIAGSRRADVRTRDGFTTVESGDDGFFRRYFDLDTDYSRIVSACAAFPETGEAVGRARGLRILRQDLFEVILGFITSANNNIPRIRGTLERLSAAYGADMGGYFAFPTPERLRDVTPDAYRALGAGFRDQYLFGAVRAALETDILTVLPTLGTEAAGRRLRELKGVGEKVADCILLFGLGRGDVCPVDTWIFKAYRSQTLNTPQKVRAYCMERYGAYAGYVQQYVFYNNRSEVKKIG